MTNQIHLQAEASFQQLGLTVQSACHATLKLLKLDHSSLTVVLTSEAAIHRLNLEFAGEDHATDVLSFPSGEPDPDTGLHYLGDIVIAVPIADQQSKARGHNLTSELNVLAVHGTLHLLGYDHDDADSKERMWSVQQEVLRQMELDTSSMDDWA